MWNEWRRSHTTLSVRKLCVFVSLWFWREFSSTATPFPIPSNHFAFLLSFHSYKDLVSDLHSFQFKISSNTTKMRWHHALCRNVRRYFKIYKKWKNFLFSPQNLAMKLHFVCTRTSTIRILPSFHLRHPRFCLSLRWN